MTSRAIAWPLVAIIALGLSIISIGSACTKNQRLQTIHASLVSVNTSRDEFANWDLEHQRQLLKDSTSREEALAKLAAYEERRRVVETSFELAYRAMALAATQADDSSLSAAIDAVRALVQSISELQKGREVRDGSDVSTDTPPTKGP